MLESMDASGFMQLIYGLLKELRATRQYIDDAIVFHKILTHLPSRFDHFVRVVQNKKNIPPVSELFNRLHLEDSNLKLRFANLREEALIMRIRNVICGGRFGHLRRNTYRSFSCTDRHPYEIDKACSRVRGLVEAAT